MGSNLRGDCWASAGRHSPAGTGVHALRSAVIEPYHSPVKPRDYDAICLDLDGTLLNGQGQPLPEVVQSLHAAQARGVQVMVVTGRSKVATVPVLEQLGLGGVAVVFNGAAVYCTERERLLEERTLSSSALRALRGYGERTGDLTILMTASDKLCVHPRDDEEARSLEGLLGLRFVGREQLRAEYVIRVTFLSKRPIDSAAYAHEIESAVGQPLYTTHFPLNVLPKHRESTMHAVDVQPPCQGKAEALRLLAERHGIAPERVVAVGDATNDSAMVQAAGLGVAMGNSMPELKQQADRIIGHHDKPAIAGLVKELFL